jgi:hypothetical protein
LHLKVPIAHGALTAAWATGLSIGKLATGQADYCLEQARGRVDAVTSVRSGVEDHYFDGPEPVGEWMGGGARALGL